VFDPNYSSGSSKTLKTIILAINPKIVPSIKDLISTKLLDNPDIVWEAEACLSLPNIAKKVPRLKSIKLKAFDINGKQFSKRFNDYSARIIQHEMDHLYGRMIVDYSDPESYITKNELSLE
jgi:peptide deformylase